MCKEIGRLLGVDIRQNSPQSANGLYRAVEALEDDLRKVKREYEAVKFDLEETRKHAHGVNFEKYYLFNNLLTFVYIF